MTEPPDHEAHGAQAAEDQVKMPAGTEEAWTDTKPIWQLSRDIWQEQLGRDEQRLLLITFAGTVAANIITAFVLGLAIWIAHVTSNGWQYDVVFVLLIIAVLAAFTRLGRPGKSRIGKARVRIIGAFSLTGVIVALLSMLGSAAGIK